MLIRFGVHRHGVTLAVLLLALACAGDSDHSRGSGSGDPPRVMPVSPDAFTEGMELEPVARLGSPSASASVREDAALYPCTVAALGADGFLAARTYAPGTLLAFEPDAEVPLEFGRRGQGPGEFGTDLRLVVPESGDRIRVVDNTNLRVSEIDGEGRWLGSTRLPGRTLSHAALGEREMVVYVKPSNEPLDGTAVIQRLDLESGATSPLLSADPGLAALELDQWVVNTTPRGQVVAAQIWTGRVLVWEPGASEPTRVIEALPADRDPPELDARLLEGVHETRPPPPSVSHVDLDADGRLWVYWLMPDSEWTPGMPGNSILDWATATFDTEVLVIDPADTEPVARARFPFVLSPVCGRPLMYSVEWSESGDVEAVVWRPTMTGPAPRAQETATYEVYAVEYASIPTVRLSDWLPGADSALTTPGSYIVWLLKGPEGRNVLVDTGFRWDVPSRATFPLPVQDYVRPDSAVAKAGVPPEDVSDVILTHVHWDHADGTPLFPNARVWIQRAEFEYYSDAVENGGPGAREVEPRVMEQLQRLRAEGRLTLVDGDDREIFDGIRVYTGARHTHESQYVGVNTEGGTVIVASDNAWFYANLELNLANAGTHDAAGQLAAQDRMRTLAANPTWILPGHDRRVFELFPEPGRGIARIR